MTSRLTHRLAAVLACILLVTASVSLAQHDEAEQAWCSLLGDAPREVEPRDLELISIQVSKLRRGPFGHGKAPWLFGSARSFVVATGTGIYGTFALEVDDVLRFQPELSSVDKFVDNTGKDLTENPGEETINEFFEYNRPLSVQLTEDSPMAVFTLRGYAVPAQGAITVRAKARLAFVRLSEEASETRQINGIESDMAIRVGPLAMSIHHAVEGPTATGRSTNAPSGDDRGAWALEIAARPKPVKSIALLDERGVPIVELAVTERWQGKPYRHYLKELQRPPTAVRVAWYEEFEYLVVPLDLKASIGI